MENVDSAPVVTATPNYSLEDVRRAIFRAGTSKGWRMENVGPNRIIGSITVRDASAQVAIDYDRRNYSINYRDSSNLKYDNGTIRGGYNRWINNLDQEIRTEISGL